MSNLGAENVEGNALVAYFRGQSDAYVRSDEKQLCVKGCNYRCVTKFIGVYNVVLLILYIVRVVLCEPILSAHLAKLEEDGGDDFKFDHDYTAIFAIIEVLTFVGQTYAVFVFFRWKTRNN